MKKLYSAIMMFAMMVAALNLTSCGSIYDNEQPIPLVVRILVVIIAIIIALGIAKFLNTNEKEEIKKRKMIYEERRKMIEKEKVEKETRIRERQTKIETYKTQFGKCTKAISNPHDSMRDYIRVYEESSVILINDVKYRFDEIIGYNLTDNSKVIKGELSSSTSTSSPSAIGRAVVGAALGGVAGAVIGGTTAKQKTEFKQGEDKTIHDFTVNINVNRLSEPLVKIHIGNNEDLSNEISALINAIVARNK